MAGHIRDRWMTPDPENPRKRIRTTRYGNGKRWTAVWVEPDGTRRSKSCDTKDEAQAHLDGVNHQLRSRTYIPAEIANMRFSDYFTKWQTNQHHVRSTTKTTQDSRASNSILPALGEYPMSEISRATIQTVVNQWATQYAPGTVELTLQILAQVFNSAVQDSIIVKSPVNRINRPAVARRIDKPMTVTELEAMAGAMRGDAKKALRFNAGIGMRPSELAGLTWEHVIDLPNGNAIIEIETQINKAGTALVPLKTIYSLRQPLVGPHIRAELGARGTGFVFRNKIGNPFNVKTLGNAWSNAREQTGLTHLKGWHDLRHFHASQLIANNISPVAVARRLGHKDARETLKTYAHLWPSDDQRMAEVSEQIFVASTERPGNE